MLIIGSSVFELYAGYSATSARCMLAYVGTVNSISLAHSYVAYSYSSDEDFSRTYISEYCTNSSIELNNNPLSIELNNNSLIISGFIYRLSKYHLTLEEFVKQEAKKIASILRMFALIEILET
jgi:hypothetical protein